MRIVVTGHALEDVACGWSPQSDDREILRRLPQVDGRVALSNLQPQPAEVAVDVAGSRDDPIVVFGETSDGYIGGDAPVFLQQLCVDHAAGWTVYGVAGHPLEQRRSAGAGDLDLSK